MRWRLSTVKAPSLANRCRMARLDGRAMPWNGEVGSTFETRSMIDPDPAPGRHGVRHLARIVLCAFLLTFIVSRIVVLLIMSRVLPDLYLHLGGTHVHHLNYGILLLVGVGAWMLFAPPPGGRPLAWCAIAYGIGLALTF